jgi:hypothetical protein
MSNAINGSERVKALQHSEQRKVQMPKYTIEAPCPTRSSTYHRVAETRVRSQSAIVGMVMSRERAAMELKKIYPAGRDVASVFGTAVGGLLLGGGGGVAAPGSSGLSCGRSSSSLCSFVATGGQTSGQAFPPVAEVSVSLYCHHHCCCCLSLAQLVPG